MSKRNLGNDATQVNAAKFEKTVTRTSQRGHSAPSHFRMRGHERMSGGADVKSKSTVSATNTNVEANPKENSEASASDNVAAEAEKEIEAILTQSNDQESTGDKKVDEMIAYVLQNLQEAGKALASLDENSEHDLKLMVVDVMGKIQNWVSLAQIRIDAARNDLKNITKELITRSKQLAAKDREIAIAKQILIQNGFPETSLEKILLEQSQKTAGALLNTSAMSFKPMRQEMPIAIPSASSGQVRADSHILSSEASALQHQQRFSPENQSQFGPGSQQQLGPGNQQQLGPGNQQQLGPETQQQLGPGSQQQFGLGAQQQISSGTQTARDEITTDVAVQSGKGKTREAELESELARLRKENETIMKERADYENAIQRALLRGVSSLNAETLKVLRCPPPVACHVPCGPPPSPVNASETMTACVSSRTKEERAATGCRASTTASTKRGGSKMSVNENYSQDRGCCSAKKSASSAYGSSSRHRKSSGHEGHSLKFIQQPPISPSACIAPCNKNFKSRSCSRPKSKKLEGSICTRNLE